VLSDSAAYKLPIAAGFDEILRKVGKTTRVAHLRTALFFAVLVHLLVAAIIYDLPGFGIPSLERGSIINVFLSKESEEKKLDQNLNRPSPLPDTDQLLSDPSLGAASTEQGEETSVSDSSPQTEAQTSEAESNDSDGKTAELSVKRELFITRSMIKVFADQETSRQLANKEGEYQRFQRSFNSYYSYRRRNRAESYKDRYGDYYVRSSSAVGDVCFVQKQELVPSELSTNTVYFYRCGKEPIGLDLSKGDTTDNG